MQLRPCSLHSRVEQTISDLVDNRTLVGLRRAGVPSHSKGLSAVNQRRVLSPTPSFHGSVHGATNPWSSIPRWYESRAQWKTNTARMRPSSRLWPPPTRSNLHASPSSSRHHRGSSSPCPSVSTRHRPGLRARPAIKSCSRRRKLSRSARSGQASWSRRASAATPS